MTNPPLRRVLTTVQLWGIAVGLVISGEYFGWNYGWQVAGTLGFGVATAIVTVFYVAFVFSYTELTTAIPDAGGPFAYAYRAFGPTGGFLAGYATLVDFLLAPPAIAAALGAYAHFLNPALSPLWVGVISYSVFVGINMLGVRDSANFSLIVTILAVVELLVFMGLVAPAFKFDNVVAHTEQFKWTSVFAALPFAIWLYLAIEGVAMVAEEVKDPRRTIPRAYLLSIGTLVLLAVGTMLLCAGAGDWRRLATIDYPLPETLAMVLGHNSVWTRLFASIGLFGLVASFHCNTLGYSRQIYVLARNGYLPAFLAQVNERFRTPHWALVVGGGIGLVALFSGSTDQIIVLSALGAIVMYGISLVSLLALRRREPTLERPFKTPFYPFLPLLALFLSLICLLAIVYFNPRLSALFLGLGGLSLLVFRLVGRRAVPVKLNMLD
ncbi:ethanolamine permease [Fibrella aquatilis]|uniref:Ethanolamine permease n=1 Tax=Fibrella aquatilis TaxID=2817059 RepID=A0A939GAP5_9BACT|nr:ethanolamine permease [Fibrella aquatilis]MBO0933167.1 ethanolamine permease [Fibrella aquatilis]